MSSLLLALILCFSATTAFTAELQSPSSAEICGDCHRAIFEGWKTSAHATAMESRLFQDALELAEEDFGASSRRVCLSCHSPVGVQIGDLDLVKKVSWEGVTCDYCHSIREITTTGENPKAQVVFSMVKSGPWKDAVSTAHGTAYSSVHTTSKICLPCHEYKNSLGFPVLTTYSEWEKSSYAKGGQGCQSCHMSSVKGEVVDPRVKRTTETNINLHQVPGGHSIQQLNKALRASLSASHEGGQVRVAVNVTNRGAGHYVPTGSPLRQLILEVRADSSGGQHFREKRVYRRSVAGQDGKIVDREPNAFIKGARVVNDTRLAPKESRTETFTFPVPNGTQTQVEADFYYYYSPMARTEAQQEVKFLTIRRIVQ
jgi:Cytochrome c554 and c-prime